MDNFSKYHSDVPAAARRWADPVSWIKSRSIRMLIVEKIQIAEYCVYFYVILFELESWPII